METVGGKFDLGKLKITNNFSINRVWTELSQLRGAIGEENVLKKSRNKLKVDIEKKNKIKNIIRDERQGIKHGVHGVQLLYSLMRNFVYDIHVIIGILGEMVDENEKLKQKGLPPKISEELETNLRKALREIKGYLRTDSDTLGALANSIKV